MKLSTKQIKEIERRFGDVRDMGDHYIVSVDGNGSEDETEAILVELQQFLGSAWICEWTGCSNTDSYGCTTEDISVSPNMRYEIRPIRDPEMTRLGAVIATAESRPEAEAIASDESTRQWGVVIIDTLEQTIDWGDRVTTIQEWLEQDGDYDL